MRALATVLPAALLLAAAPATAQPEDTQWRPALYLLGTSERGRGAAYAPPLDPLRQDDAASVALGLDVRSALPAGKLEASAFALAHDPASAADRGFFLAARARATFSLGDGWLLRLEDAPRVQRRESVGVSDFERNELWVELERRTSGPAVGLRVSDRRRSVRGNPVQGFSRQWLSATLGGGSPDRSWRLEAGPQHYRTDVARGWRFAAALELQGSLARTRTALRLSWVEPPAGGGTGEGARPTTAPPGPALPPGTPQPGGPAPGQFERPPVADTVAPAGSPGFSPPPQLVGPVLVVDPTDSDEADWDFGRRKLELRLLATRRLPGEVAASLELRGQRERGPDLTVIGPAVRVARDRLVLRASLRRAFGTRLALLAEGSWQRVRDGRPGFAYARTIVAAGVELRP